MFKSLRNKKGQATIEFGYAIPIIVFVLIALIEVPTISTTYFYASNAARNAARRVTLNVKSGNQALIIGQKEGDAVWKQMRETNVKVFPTKCSAPEGVSTDKVIYCVAKATVTLKIMKVQHTVEVPAVTRTQSIKGGG